MPVAWMRHSRGGSVSRGSCALTRYRASLRQRTEAQRKVSHRVCIRGSFLPVTQVTEPTDGQRTIFHQCSFLDATLSHYTPVRANKIPIFVVDFARIHQIQKSFVSYIDKSICNLYILDTPVVGIVSGLTSTQALVLLQGSGLRHVSCVTTMLGQDGAYGSAQGGTMPCAAHRTRGWCTRDAARALYDNATVVMCLSQPQRVQGEDTVKMRGWVGTSPMAGQGRFAAQHIKKGTASRRQRLGNV